MMVFHDDYVYILINFVLLHESEKHSFAYSIQHYIYAHEILAYTPFRISLFHDIFI